MPGLSSSLSANPFAPRALRWPLFGLALLPLMGAQAVAAPLAGGALSHGLVQPSPGLMQAISGRASAFASAAALPTGAVVKAGQASITSPSGAALIINQASNKAIIDWSSFSIGQGNSVDFKNGSGATLNRVLSGGPLSFIDGLLSATGSVYLLNPNGVIIGKDGVVNVGGSFVASTLDLSDSAFLNGGNLTFTGPSSQSVVNLGKVGSLGGDVALIATSIRNEGSIAAPQGAVGLVAGSSVLVRDQASDGGKFAVLVGGPNTSSTNSGSIQAAEAELRAEGGNVYALAGNTSGVIRATGVSDRDGKVFLVADGGTVQVGGAIEAQGPDGTGGKIETSGQTVLIGQANIDAHGGTWLIDPYDLTIDQTAANSIAGALNNYTNVTEQTTATGASGYGTQNPAGNGDINIDPNVSIKWSTPYNLTLSAYRNINFGSSATITSSAGGVTLYADNTGIGTGAVNFGSGAGISAYRFVTIYYDPPSNPAGSTVNPTSYTSPTSYSAYVSGGATLTAYMLVNTDTDLQNMQNNRSALYALGRNIDASGTQNWNGGAGFMPVGDVNTYFSGTLDGQGHTISGLYINRPNMNEVGLFGVITGQALNIVLANANVTGSVEVGTLAGVNAGTITKDQSSGSVTGQESVGGLVGHNNPNATVGEPYPSAYGYGPSSSSATVTSSYLYAGGLVGENDGIIGYGSATGAVNGVGDVGGLVGINTGQAGINYSSATGSVHGTNAVGGFVGWNLGEINASTATGAVTGTNLYAGGFAGVNQGSLVNVPESGWAGDSASGAVSGVTDVGGFVGLNLNVIAQGSTGGTTPAGAVSGTNAVGGFAGWNGPNGSIGSGEDIPSTANQTQVTGSYLYTGGFVGVNQGTASGTVNGGSVQGNSNVGGFAGYNASGGALSGQTSAAVSGTNAVGGFVGVNDANAGVSGLRGITLGYATGNVTGSYLYAGGFVGVNNGLITDSTSSGSVQGLSNVGGFAGYNTGPIYASSVSPTVIGAGTSQAAQPTVAGKDAVGGAIGWNASGGAVDGVSAGATVTGTDYYAGGLVGVNEGTVTNIYAIGAVSGVYEVGGLIGWNRSSGGVAHGYDTGKVSGTSMVGGIAGLNDGSLANLFWDEGTTGMTNPVGVNNATASDLTGMGGSTGVNPYSKATYHGFDFTKYWAISDGLNYPYLIYYYRY